MYLPSHYYSSSRILICGKIFGHLRLQQPKFDEFKYFKSIEVIFKNLKAMAEGLPWLHSGIKVLSSVWKSSYVTGKRP